MSLIKRPTTLRMAPPGYHVVKKHLRISETGVKYYVKAHLRKNKGTKYILLPENILYLYWHGEHNNTRLGKVLGFSEHLELDSVIHFWLNFWKEMGFTLPENFDPFLIKVIIAVESSFRIKADPRSRVSSAYGLMQITNWTRNDLKGIRRKGKVSLTDHFLDLERKDLEDPVISIAAGIRWLTYKYSSIPKNKRTLFNLIRAYNDWEKGEPYAEKVMDLYNSSQSGRFK
jgi:hypothetical protein